MPLKLNDPPFTEPTYVSTLLNVSDNPSTQEIRISESFSIEIDSAFYKEIRQLPRLASLRSINSALTELLRSENNFTFQIAEIIRRDPSLTTRLLRLVNSVFFGFSRKITCIEEAVFYLGLRQIRELAMVTPVIEEIEQLSDSFQQGRWQQLWLHSIGTAILTREIAQPMELALNEENDYIAGLVHNIGKIVMALIAPKTLESVTLNHAQSSEDISSAERTAIGYDHAMIGGLYLHAHQLSEDIVESVMFHHHPRAGGPYAKLAAAIQVADFFARSCGIPGIDPLPKFEARGVMDLDGWKLLYGEESDSELRFASIAHSASRLPTVLRGMV